MHRHSDKKNSTWLSIQFICTLIISFITLKINIINFGEELFGLWLLFASFWGIGSVLDLGFGTAVIKYVSMTLAGNSNKGDMNRITSTALFIFLSLGCILFMLGVLVSDFVFFSNMNLIKSQTLSEAKIIFLVLGVSFLLRYVTFFYSSVFEGNSNFYASSILNISYTFFTLLSVLAVYLFNLSLVILSGLYALSSLLLLCLNIFVLYKYYPGIKLRITNFDFSIAKKMSSFSISVQITSLLGALADPSIKYIIGNYGSLSTVSYFEIARKFGLAITGLFSTAFRTFLPKVSILETKEQKQLFILSEGISLSRLGVVYSGSVFWIFAIVIALVIQFWFGYYEAIIIFVFVSIYESINVIGYMIYVFITGIGKAYYLIFVQLFNLIIAVTGLAAGYWIFNNYLGLAGYSFSIIIGNIILLFLLKKEAAVSLPFYLRQIKAYKLLFYILLVILSAIFSYYFQFNIFLLLTFVSIISFFLHYNDIIRYCNYFLKHIPLFNISGK